MRYTARRTWISWRQSFPDGRYDHRPEGRIESGRYDLADLHRSVSLYALVKLYRDRIIRPAGVQ